MATEATAVVRLIAKRSISVRGHKTSVSLERDFWGEIKRIAAANGQSVPELIAAIDDTRPGNLSSALRVFVLSHYQAMANIRRADDLPTGSIAPQPLLHSPATDETHTDEAAAP
jgi:predicted DNA-binding ribbon-helix-helix protein